jgi:hypothetical protein
MGYRAVVEWVKDSAGRAMGVVPGTLHVRVAVGSQPDVLGPVRVMKPTHGTLSARKLGRCPWPEDWTRVIMEASGVGD